MSEWITDRLPTLADADEDGDVQLMSYPDCPPDQGGFAPYRCVLPGQPWWSPKAAAAAQPTRQTLLDRARVVTALAVDGLGVIVAACNDGTIWNIGSDPEWTQLPSIPQPEAPNA